ncbi:response regulator [Blautia glucerasea]|jgi:two-component system response regulator YesN|uniref:response regulator transcription factor n=1 Tax=Blautia glucerasea TaxID=536633 RepID=UPI001D01AD9E|nr:response regulator [Blautia glucerasea]MCB5385544.1 response regulator [Blautia glucerasea]MCB5420223.1 response regulator [Blautia luti]
MYRILLVDDEILVRDAIKENIDWKSMDCELVGDCENGKQAADFVKTHPVDIVLTDILMPYMDGMELSHFLHDHYPEIVIVIFSGFGEFEYAKKAIQYNVSEYMLKPVTAMELREVIGKMKEKVDQQRKEKKKMESLTKTSQDYHKNALVIRSKAIESLVSCTRDVQESLDELTEMGICLEAASYRVAVFDMDLFSGIHQIDMEKRQESALMAFVLFNVADEIVTGKNAGIAYQEGNNRVCILFMGNHSREFACEIQEICEEIQKKVKEVIGIEVSAGIGGWVRNPGETIQSHNQAEKAIELRYLLGGNLLIDTETLSPERSLSLRQPLSNLVDGIKKENKEELQQALAVMKSEIKKVRADKSQACVCLQMILRHAGSCWESLSSENEDLFHKRELLMGKVTEQKTFSEAFRMVEDYVYEVFERCSSMNSSSGQKQALLAMEYIRGHYNEPEFGLNDICSYLNIGTSYFSTIFKETTGGTFLEFLSKVRMEKAKELLEQTTLKNYEIAEMVGYSDPHYFGISFKKMTGKTPTEYAREKRSV